MSCVGGVHTVNGHLSKSTVMRASRRLQYCAMAATLALSWTMVCMADAPVWSQWHNSLAPTGAQGPELTLADNGQTSYRIVIPVTATTQDIKAAEDLQYWLQQITGVQLPIVSEPSPPGNDCLISVGRTTLLEQSGLPEANVDLGDEGYGIAVQDHILYLWGGRTRGAINAVYALLEEDLGCRWYTTTHARIPWQPTLTFAPTPRTYKPPLQLRDPFYYVAFDENWSLRNRTNAPWAPVREAWGGHVDYGDLFVHTFTTLVPPSIYFDSHPEYFMLDEDGERSRAQLCTTNPDVIQLVTQGVLNHLATHPDTEIVSVSKNDSERTCLCPNCKALDDAEGTEMGSLLYLVNQVADAVAVEYPDVLISTLAYFGTTNPPLTVRPRDNVIIRLCNVTAWSRPFTPAEDTDFGQLLQAWSAIHDKISIWDYTVNYYHYLAPMPNMEVIADNIRFMTANGVKGIMMQGAYQSTGERDWMRAWVIAKLLWDPSRDWFELMQDFIWGHYGQAAPAIAEYNELLRNQRILYWNILKHPSGGIRFDMNCPFLTPEFLSSASALLDQAEALADDQEILHRVERERLPIMYVKLEQGPEVTGLQYGTVLDRFETIARRENAIYLKEGKIPNLDDKLAEWRANWENYLYLPSTPTPPTQAEDVPLNAVLSWTTRGDAISYNVYFGTTNPPTFAANVTTNSWTPGVLAGFETYFWRVDTVHEDGITTGNVWTFTTRTWPDFDNDGDIDQEDFGHLQACFGTADTRIQTNCANGDLDNDKDVDQGDYAIFQGCLTAPNIPADLTCLNYLN